MGPVRMISSGHELTTDYDEKTLHELGFKDMQVTAWFLSLALSVPKNNNYKTEHSLVGYSGLNKRLLFHI